MKKSDVLMASAIAGVLSLALAGPVAAAEAPKGEKCYGVSKVGKNDCQTASSSCAGTAKKDGQKDAFVFLPAGACEKIVGGSVKPTKS